MKYFKSINFTLLFIIIFSASLNAAPSIAFGYLHNKTNDANYEYLETIFPNSFANSIRNIFNVRVVKPHRINQKLEKHKLKLLKNYNLYELPELLDRVKTNFFIYGNFTPKPNDRIEIVLHMYQKGSNRIFSFTNVGKMETEIFKLVDRITMVLINFLSSKRLYRSTLITPPTKLGILTNLGGDDLNILYYKFLEKGYRVSSMQGNYPESVIFVDDINKFQYMSSAFSSYDIITDKRKVIFPFGTWAGQVHTDRVNELRRIYKYYDENADATQRQVLNKLKNSYKNTIDSLLIIGFNKRRTRAWVRCYNLKDDDIVWMQSNIKGRSIKSICDKMMKEMNSKIQDIFDKKHKKGKKKEKKKKSLK